MRKPRVGSIVLVIGLIFIAAVLLPDFIRNQSLIRAWRNDGVTQLSAAQTPDELRMAIGRLGAFVPLQDGNWIAIYYRDSHSAIFLPIGGIPSLAVARDSGGGWFESTQHFCGVLRSFDEWVKSQIDPDSSQIHAANAERMTFESSDGDLRNVFHASDLEDARAELLKTGFRPIKK